MARGGWARALLPGLASCGALYLYALWAALSSYRYRHYDPDWAFAEGQGFLLLYDVLFTYLPTAIVITTVVLLMVRPRLGVIAALFANALIAANAVTPFLKERQLLMASKVVPGDVSLLSIAILVWAVVSLALLIAGSRARTVRCIP